MAHPLTRPSRLLVAAAVAISFNACTGVQLQDDVLGRSTGLVTDADGEPVAGAVVSVAGVSTTTAADGRFTVDSPLALAAEPLITVSAAGYSDHIDDPATIDPTLARATTGNDRWRVRLRPAAAPQRLLITSPTPAQHVTYDPCAPQIAVSGYVGRWAEQNSRLDLVLLIDRSGSTAGVDGDSSVYAQAIAAAQLLVAALQPGVNRVAVIAFAAEAEVVVPLTDALDQVQDGLEALRATGPLPPGQSGSGTDFAAGLDAAGTHLLARVLTEESSDTGTTQALPSCRQVVLLSDGIPTLPTGSGLTQEGGDIAASLAAGRRLRQNGICLHAVAIQARDRHLSTMPALAALSRGSYRHLQPEDLAARLARLALRQVGRVIVENAVTGDRLVLEPGPDGRFTGSLPITVGAQEILVRASLQGSTLTETIPIQADSDHSGPAGLAEEKVATRGLVDPYGADLDDSPLADFLLANYPDLIETLGTNTYTVTGEAGTMTPVSVELVARQAGWHSDLAMLVLAPDADPVAALHDALAASDDDDRLFNTHDLPPDDGAALMPDPGTLVVVRQLPAGSQVAFLLAPKGTLADARAGRGKPPVATVDDFNLGAFDQVLTFWSPAGRATDPGTRSVIVFEDQPLANRSDRDFWDVILAADGLLPASNGACPLADD